MKQIPLALLCATVAAVGAGVSVHLWRQALDVGQSSLSSGGGLPATQQRAVSSSFSPAGAAATVRIGGVGITTTPLAAAPSGPGVQGNAVAGGGEGYESRPPGSIRRDST